MRISENSSSKNKKMSSLLERLDQLAKSVSAKSSVSGKATAGVGASVVGSSGKATPSLGASVSGISAKGSAVIGATVSGVSAKWKASSGTSASSSSGKAAAGAGSSVSNTATDKTRATATGSDASRLSLNGTQRAESALVAKLPSDFPIAKWDKMTTKEQYQTIRRSGLTDQEQWRLLNTSTPLEVLSLVNAAQNSARSGLLTPREASDLTDRSLRYSAARSQLVSGDASILPPLQKGLLHGKLDEVFAKLKAKAEGEREPGNDDPPAIFDYPAIEHMLGGKTASVDQKAKLDEAQKSLDRLYKKGNPTQQQIDEVIAEMCTKLLNDENAPRTKASGEKQTYIPAYTDAINSLLDRLREDAALAVYKRKNIPISQPYYTERYFGEFLDVFTRNLENGDLNLRNQHVWNEMISTFSPEAPPLDGSQYLFVYDGELMSSEDLGNMVYGYYWTGFGIPKNLLYLGAGIVSITHDVLDSDPSSNPNLGNGTLGDDVADRAAIDKGISKFLEGK